MNFAATITIASAAIALLAGSFVFSKSPRALLNALFLLVAVSVAYFSIATFGQIQADSFEEATQWSRSGMLWPLIYALVLHLALVFAQKDSLLRQPLTYVVIYAPAVVISAIDIMANSITAEPIQQTWGWSDDFKQGSGAASLAAGWSLVIAIDAEVLLFARYRKAPDSQAKQQAKFALLGSFFPLAAGVLDGILPYYGATLPNFSVPGFAIGCVFIGYGIWRHGLFTLTPEFVADEVLATLLDPLILIDPLGNIVHMNRATTTVSGFNELELVGKSCNLLYIDMVNDGNSLETRTLNDFVRHGVGGQTTAWMNTKTGQRVPVDLSISVLNDDDGEYIGLICNGQDITEKLRKQEEISSLQRRIESILESAGDGVIALDRNGAATFVNQAASDMTGWDIDDIKAPGDYERLHSPHSPNSNNDCPINLTLRDGLPRSIDELFLRKDGTSFQAARRVTAMLGDKGELAGAVMVFRDTTVLKQAEVARIDRAALSARSEELGLSRRRIVESSEKLRRDMAAHLHGSVQNRLIVLLHRLNEIDSMTSKQEIEKRLDGLHHDLERILDTDLRRITQQLFPAVLNRGLSPALESLAERFRDTLALRMEIHTGAPESESDRIPEQVRLSAYRIVEEALTNTLKHSEASEVIVNARISGDELEITVRDNGKGFDQTPHETGLGLGTIYDYADVVDGTANIHSEVGRGTVIQTRLPLSVFAGVPGL
jgi:PAS domain S-box-containing protein